MNCPWATRASRGPNHPLLDSWPGPCPGYPWVIW
uniref:Uncharacterized protein n=1 Tax=Arundo donax TaxID=35708 RepID=A0A0A9FLT7_ARUDO